MLERQVNGFIDYCKVSGFKDKSIKSLSINPNKFKIFLIKIHVRPIKKITYRHLLGFVADFESPSIHIKKARVWTLRQFFHFLVETIGVKPTLLTVRMVYDVHPLFLLLSED